MGVTFVAFTAARNELGGIDQNGGGWMVPCSERR